MDKSIDVVINTKKLCKSYTNGEVQQHVIKNMDIQLFNRDFTVFMGPSGSEDKLWLCFSADLSY